MASTKPPPLPGSRASEERRRFPRVAVEATNLRLAAQDKVVIDKLVDFSLGGLQVELSRDEVAPKIGNLLDVSLEWDGGAQRFDASVRRVITDDDGRHRVGIEFDDPALVEKLLGSWYRAAKR